MLSAFKFQLSAARSASSLVMYRSGHRTSVSIQNHKEGRSFALFFYGPATLFQSNHFEIKSRRNSLILDAVRLWINLRYNQVMERTQCIQETPSQISLCSMPRLVNKPWKTSSSLEAAETTFRKSLNRSIGLEGLPFSLSSTWFLLKPLGFDFVSGS